MHQPCQLEAALLCRGAAFRLLPLRLWRLVYIVSGVPGRSMDVSATQRHDTTPWDPLDPLSKHVEFGFSCILLFIKGDWAELVKNVGLASWSSWINPCFLCTASSEELHNLYRSCTLDEWPFALRDGDSYDRACAACEHKVVLRSEAVRTTLLAALVYDKKLSGLVLQRDLPGLGLLEADRLEPSPSLIDVSKLAQAPLGITIVFWRRCLLVESVLDPVNHRCPLFCGELHTTPDKSIAIDSLHTLYFGPCMRHATASLCRLVDANPWQVRGTAKAKVDIGFKRLTADLHQWYDIANVPHDRRVSELTPKLLAHVGVDYGPHQGGLAPLKAAEVSVIMHFAVFALESYPAAAAYHDELLSAGRALCDLLSAIHSAGPIPTHLETEYMFDSMVQHLVSAEAALIHMVPKHHLSLHLICRTALSLVSDQFLFCRGPRTRASLGLWSAPPTPPAR